MVLESVEEKITINFCARAPRVTFEFSHGPCCEATQSASHSRRLDSKLHEEKVYERRITRRVITS